MLLIIFLTFLPTLPTIPVEANPKVIVVPDDYLSIQEAIDTASDGDVIIVRKGIYNESIRIDKRIRVRGEGNETIIDATDKEIGILITTGNVEVCNLTVKNAKLAGIKVESNNNLIENNTLVNNGHGIYMPEGSSGNIIKNNTITENRYSGIFMLTCGSNVIEGNTFTKNSRAIDMSGCTSNKIISNTFLENEDGILLLVAPLKGRHLYSTKNIIRGNKFEKNKQGIGTNFASGNLIQGNTFIADSIDLEKSGWNVITNNKLQNTKMILSDSSDGNLIANNTLQDDSYIYVHTSSENKVLDNWLNFSDISCYAGRDNVIAGNFIINGGIYLFATYSFTHGYYFEDTAYQNLVENNTILNATRGICMDDAISNIVRNNTIIECEIGIYVIGESCMNSIEENKIRNNEEGICITATGNKVARNDLIENDIGICVYSFPNFFYHNNFIDNKKQAEASGKNTWDRNYWSDYEGDGPYVISKENVDSHPLMKPYQHYKELPEPKITMRGLNVTVSPSRIVVELRDPATIIVNVTNIGAIPEVYLMIEVYLDTFWSAPIFQRKFGLEPFESKVFEVGIPTDKKGRQDILIVVGVVVLNIIHPSFGPYETREIPLIVRERSEERHEEPGGSENPLISMICIAVIVAVAIILLLFYPTGTKKDEGSKDILGDSSSSLFFLLYLV